ncbi:MAG: dTDP-4-dehydrorhamnose 3,5-epimerase family protein [bacterium]
MSIIIQKVFIESLAIDPGLKNSEDQLKYLLSIYDSEEDIIATAIPGVVVKERRVICDHRGWSNENYRICEDNHKAVQGYNSMTYVGKVRGPHEHIKQTDFFVFFGHGTFELSLWENRAGLPMGNHLKLLMPNGSSYSVLVPPGVVHGYKCVPTILCPGPLEQKKNISGICWNGPDQYYAGENRNEPVDEIRHENDPNSPFKIE